jgi:hypothetical protein
VAGEGAEAGLGLQGELGEAEEAAGGHDQRSLVGEGLAEGLGERLDLGGPSGLREHQAEIDRDQGGLGRAGLQEEPQADGFQHLQGLLPLVETAQRARFQPGGAEELARIPDLREEAPGLPQRAPGPVHLPPLRQTDGRGEPHPQGHPGPGLPAHLRPAVQQRGQRISQAGPLHLQKPQKTPAAGLLAGEPLLPEQAGRVPQKGVGLVGPPLLPADQRGGPAVQGPLAGKLHERRRPGQHRVGPLQVLPQAPRVGAEAEGPGQGRRRLRLLLGEIRRQPGGQVGQLLRPRRLRRLRLLARLQQQVQQIETLETRLAKELGLAGGRHARELREEPLRRFPAPGALHHLLRAQLQIPPDLVVRPVLSLVIAVGGASHRPPGSRPPFEA